MGKIIGVNAGTGDKIKVTLEMTQGEFEFLQGSLDKMHVFTEKNLTYSTRLVQRGRRESTRYILLPKEFRAGITITNDLKCAQIETQNKKFLVFAVNKF